MAEDVEALISTVDVDGDGQINYEEFSKIIVDEATIHKARLVDEAAATIGAAPAGKRSRTAVS